MRRAAMLPLKLSLMHAVHQTDQASMYRLVPPKTMITTATPLSNITPAFKNQASSCMPLMALLET